MRERRDLQATPPSPRPHPHRLRQCGRQFPRSLQRRLHGDDVGVRPEARDHALHGGRQFRMPVQFVSRVDVGDVDFVYRPPRRPSARQTSRSS
jgi:hypothetical protein